MSIIKFTETKLTNSGKKGVLKPDENGYYEIVIGGLNTLNSAGEYYVYESAKHLFEQSSSFMRRIKSGCLKGELGHPKRTPGMSADDYLQRIMTIEETNVVCHYADIYLDTDFGRKNPQFKNPQLVAMIAKVKPAGPKGACLQASIDNPREEVCFSIRALTKDQYVNGRNERTLVQIICHDVVTEPGIAISRKWESPGLESISETPITVKQLERMAERSHGNLAMESIGSLAKETLKIVEFTSRPIAAPRYSQW